MSDSCCFLAYSARSSGVSSSRSLVFRLSAHPSLPHFRQNQFQCGNGRLVKITNRSLPPQKGQGPAYSFWRLRKNLTESNPIARNSTGVLVIPTTPVRNISVSPYDKAHINMDHRGHYAFREIQRTLKLQKVLLVSILESTVAYFGQWKGNTVRELGKRTICQVV